MMKNVFYVLLGIVSIAIIGWAVVLWINGDRARGRIRLGGFGAALLGVAVAGFAKKE